MNRDEALNEVEYWFDYYIEENPDYKIIDNGDSLTVVINDE